jgi:Fe-S-cluster containining protein
MPSLVARRRKISGEKFLKFRCTDCGNCCTDTLVPVTHLDLLRMQKGLGLKAGEIVEFFKGSEFEDEGEGLQFVELDMGPRVMCLKKRFEEKEERESCKFYRDQRCSVYEHRPVTCRVWPFTLSLDKEGKRVKGLSINDSLPCPFELDGENDPAQLLKTWKWDDDQDDAYEILVKRWNGESKGQTVAAFFKYLAAH